MKTLKETDVKETSMTQSLFKSNELYHCALDGNICLLFVCLQTSRRD